jgi:LTXXQ motif family protein
MAKTTVAIGTILLAAAAALMALPADAAFRGGGGGGFHGGGGGFHGGGFHGGGGGFHGGGMRMGGFHAGGGRMGGMHIGRLGGLHSGGLTHQGFHGGNHALNHTMSHGHGPLATRTAASFSHRGFGHNAFLHGPGFHRFGVFGWVGPLFWPYAYNDIYCSVFWGYWGYGCADPYWTAAYGDPFWDYGYGDIYGGLFSPFAFADLAPYLPNGPSNVRVARSKGSAAPASAITQMCGDDTKEVAGWPIDRIQELVSPDDQQRAALDDLANASMKAAQIIKSGCPTSVAFTPTGRMTAMQQRIEAMEQAVATVHGPLDTFYGSLTDEQKAKFSVASPPPAQQNGRHREAARELHRDPAQSCTAANSVTQWPEAKIEAALRPTEAQQAKLKALQSATAQAAEQLAASCPADLPSTPPARLAAITKRLDIMLTAVKTVRGALDDLYAGLSDEQKAQFNQIGQSHTAERQS